jgi:hypothetical protein
VDGMGGEGHCQCRDTRVTMVTIEIDVPIGASDNSTIAADETRAVKLLAFPAYFPHILALHVEGKLLFER